MAGTQQQPELKGLDELFAAEPDRLSRFAFDLAGIHFDWSKTHLDGQLVEQFIERSKRMGFAKARDALFSGGIVNPSEGRPATHVAERGSGAPDDIDLAIGRRQRMQRVGELEAFDGRHRELPRYRPHMGAEGHTRGFGIGRSQTRGCPL